MKCFFFKHKPKSDNGATKSKEKEPDFRIFTLQELVDATKGFNRKLKIGEGGFTEVYRGTIRGGGPIVVARKKLDTLLLLKEHKEEEWLAQVQFLSVVNHPNLVKLLGYCSINNEKRGIQRYLVHEFMPNGTLEDHLFTRSSPHLSWKTRLQIMLGAAQGLRYLHNELDVQVIYRRFRSSGVLLDKKFHPKLSDFGPFREGLAGDKIGYARQFSRETVAYAAPEYMETVHLKVESDMWSFGVVLYEILTGRRALDTNRPKGEERLTEWVKKYPANSSRFSMIIDPRLKNQYSVGAARKMAKLADSCLKKNIKDRPSMSQIVESLKQALQYLETTSTSHNVTSKSTRSKLVLCRKYIDAVGE